MTVEQEKQYKLFLSLIQQAQGILIDYFEEQMEDEDEEAEIEDKINTLSDILGWSN